MTKKSIYMVIMILFTLFSVFWDHLPGHQDSKIKNIIVGNTAFSVELARSEEELTKGLMFRDAIGDDEGMLFDFGFPVYAGMWMKDTIISLDMLFIAESGEVVYIVENRQPMSLEISAAEVPVRYVLEVKGGTVQKAGIKTGDWFSFK